ncbi:hypothetical protein T4B_8265 [Trichinella pseudospiralis]|uniref:Uncharacterized protein n=1 Tax=Trichinella pseudospiralis TaxID=6337 RepID=A0A0V1JFI5_TRIPS|nr:hypothetical protein T4B_8265 [Trichinella pseudospiralis]KRZ37628.1 hypothetical protein T4C_3944 [Trichinella pseudospiralis]
MLAFMKSIQGDIWRGTRAVEAFLTAQEADDEESLNRDGKNCEENESNIMKNFPKTFIKD